MIQYILIGAIILIAIYFTKIFIEAVFVLLFGSLIQTVITTILAAVGIYRGKHYGLFVALIFAIAINYIISGFL